MKCLFGVVRVLLGGGILLFGTARADVVLLNVSYDVTRDSYKDINVAFIEDWTKTTGEKVAVEQSYGGASQQALAVANGLEADFADGGAYDQIVVSR